MVSFDSTRLRIANRGILDLLLLSPLPHFKNLCLRFIVDAIDYGIMQTGYVNLSAGTCLASLVEVLSEPLVDDLPVDTSEQLSEESLFCTQHHKVHIGAVQCPEVVEYHPASLVHLRGVHFG